MNHRSRSSVLGLAVASLALAITSPALAAPTPHECAAASEDATSLQKQEKLGAAKDRFLVCADAACPAEIRDECAHRLSEVTDAIPSVVFDVKDAAGNDVSAVKVTMDGAPLVDHLGSAAIPIDPGEHAFHFEGADALQAVDKSFVVRDGEKNRHLAVTMGGGAPAAAPAAATGATPPAADQASSPGGWSDRKTLAVVAGGLGIVSLGIGAAFGIMTFSQYNNAKTECTTLGCAPGSQAQSDLSTANTSATISDVGFGAGAVLVAGAVVLWITDKPSAPVQVVPTASPQGAGFTLRGTF
jgi:hypothetical protein